jgi:hypothetical protein
VSAPQVKGRVAIATLDDVFRKVLLLGGPLLLAALFVGAGCAEGQSAAVPSRPIAASVVATPRPPATYPLPSQARVVRTSGELKAALRRATRTNIVLADGVYESTRPFVNRAGHQIYAEHLGKAVVKAGLVFGGNSGTGGGLVRGVVFDVSDLTRVFHKGIVHVWGQAGTGTQVLDCVLRGHGVISFGLFVLNPEAFVAQRLRISGFTGVGLRASNNDYVPYGHATARIKAVSDIVVTDVSRPTPGSSDGTAEAGLWIGHPVTNGVRRIKVSNVSWSGIEVVNNAWDTVYSDLDINVGGSNQYAGVGIYLEHFSYRNTFQRFRIVGAKVGFTAEWDDPGWGGVAAAHFTTIRNGLIDAAGSTIPRNQAGIYLDSGTESTTVTGVIFKNQNWAAIGAYRNTGTNTFEGNDYSGLAPGAVPISNDHITERR